MLAVTLSAQTAAPPQTYKPEVGQAGKDVVWVPTADTLVKKMLDMAKMTPQDYVIDLGSGDGRTVIAAAKRGATAMGIEYNPDMVELSKKNAAAAGVSGKATFIKADIFETDYSKATVLTLFLLPDINLKLRPTILNMKPGTRVVSNSFNMGEWEPDETANIEQECTELVHRLFVDRAGEGRWHMGLAAGRSHAHADVPDGLGNAGDGADRERQAPRQRDQLYRQRDDLHRAR